ncbi:MAG: hypothetical protein JRI36_11160 [Deltaproteobacteria bacterium]|nr:hypothetical protein [Deltaproteobacteria bacterium]
MNNKEASAAVKQLLTHYKANGGAVTVNWHQRSLGPERLWTEPYLALLESFQKDGAWVTSAKNAVDWFAARRRIAFENVEIRKASVRVKLKSDLPIGKPGLCLRTHYASPYREVNGPARPRAASFDFAIRNGQDLNLFIPTPESHN